MLPVLLDLKIIRIYTFGVFAVLALFWGLFWFWRNIKKTSYKEEKMFDVAFVSLLGAVFSARLMYVLLHFEDFGFSVLKFILINGYPGLSLVGALVGGFLVMGIISKLLKIDFLEAVAYSVPAVFLTLCIGYIGAFFAGSVAGTETSFILRVSYAGYEGMRHITALYEAIIMLLGFIISQNLLMRYRRDKIHVGSIFSFFVIVLSISHASLDFFKADRVYLFGVRFNVLSGITFLLIFSIWELYKYRTALVTKFRTIIKKNGKKIPSDKGTH